MNTLTLKFDTFDQKTQIITSVAIFVKCPALVESARLNDFRVDVGTVDQEDLQAPWGFPP